MLLRDSSQNISLCVAPHELPTPPEKEKCAARAAVLHTLIWSHSFPLAGKRTVAFHSHSQVQWIAASRWIHRGQSSMNTALFSVILNASFLCIDRDLNQKLALAGDSFVWRFVSESCIAQNLCSLTINLQERGASPSHRMRIARWTVPHGLGQGYQTCAKSLILHNYQLLVISGCLTQWQPSGGNLERTTRW